MEQRIEIKVINNAYIVEYTNVGKRPGKFAFKFTEEFKLLEDIGLALLEKKVQVTER